MPVTILRYFSANTSSLYSSYHVVVAVAVVVVIVVDNDDDDGDGDDGEKDEDDDSDTVAAVHHVLVSEQLASA